MPLLFILFVLLVVTTDSDEKYLEGCAPYPPVKDGYAFPDGPVKNGEHVHVSCQYNSSISVSLQCKNGKYVGEDFKGCPGRHEPYAPDPHDPYGCREYDGVYPGTYAVPGGPYKNGEFFDIFCSTDDSISYEFRCRDGYYSGFFDGCPDEPNEPVEPPVDEEEYGGCNPYPQVENGYVYPPGSVKNGEHVTVRCPLSDKEYEVKCKDGKYTNLDVSCSGAQKPDYENSSGCGPYPHVENGYVYPHGSVKNGEHVTVTCNSTNEQYDVKCEDGTYTNPNVKCSETQRPDDGNASGCEPYPEVENGFAYPTGRLRDGEELYILCPEDLKIYTLVCSNGQHRGNFTKCGGK